MMGKIKKNQSGFSVIEVGLLLVLVGLISFVGWYVYHATKKTNDTLNSSVSSSQNTSKAATSNKVSNSAAVTGTTSKSSTISESSCPAVTEHIASHGYLTLSEWGVKVPVSGDLEQTKYSDVTCIYGGTYDIMEVSTTDSTVTTGVCKGGGIGWIHRTTDFSSLDSTAVYSHIGKYYYAYQIPQDCTESSDTGLLGQLKQAVSQMFVAN